MIFSQISKINACLLLFLLSGAVFSQNLDEKEKQLFKKGKVISETIMGYVPDEYGKASDIGVKKSMRKINREGNVTSIIEYDRKSTPTTRQIFKYNAQGKVIGSMVYKGYDELIDKYRISYQNGLKVSKKGNKEDETYEINYSYDKSKNLTSKSKKVNGAEVFTYKYAYSNNLMTSEGYTSKKMSLTKTFTYNDKKQLIKEDNKSNSFQGYTFKYEYDSLGNKVKETKYSVDELPYETYEYEYNKQKQITKITKNNLDGVPVFKWVYMYNGKGLVEIVKLYDIDMLKPVYITKYLYKYQKNN